MKPGGTNVGNQRHPSACAPVEMSSMRRQPLEGSAIRLIHREQLAIERNFCFDEGKGVAAFELREPRPRQPCFPSESRKVMLKTDARVTDERCRPMLQVIEVTLHRFDSRPPFPRDVGFPSLLVGVDASDPENRPCN